MVNEHYIQHPPKNKAFVIVVHTLMFRSSIASPVKSTAQLKPPLKRMDAAPVPYENVKDDSFEVEVAAAVANGERSNGGVVVAAERDEGDPFRTDHVDVQRKLVSLQAPDSPAVPLRRRKVVVAAASGRGFCVYRKVTLGVRSCSLPYPLLSPVLQ